MASRIVTPSWRASTVRAVSRGNEAVYRRQATAVAFPRRSKLFASPAHVAAVHAMWPSRPPSSNLHPDGEPFRTAFRRLVPLRKVPADMFADDWAGW